MARRRADDGWTDDHGKLLTDLALKRAESYPKQPPRPTHQPPTDRYDN